MRDIAMRIRMDTERAALVALLATALVAGVRPAPARADVAGADVEFEDWNVSLTTPRNWQITQETPYDSVLVVMVTRSPRGKMMFSAQEVDETLDSAGFAQATSELLEELGFETSAPQLHPATGAYWIDVSTPTAQLRQAFLSSGGVGFALTLSAESPRDRAHHLRAFDGVLRSIRLDRPEPTADAD